MEKLLIIIGPTATGKTDLALFLANKFQGELVSADSRQVYKGLDIGTGKAPSTGNWKIEDGRWIVNGINIWMYDVVDPSKQYSAADYVQDAGQVIKDIVSRGKLPVIVGGTGLYIKVLLDGLSNLQVTPNLNLRRELADFSVIALQQKLQQLDPVRWDKLNLPDRQNKRRLVRAIEITINTAKTRDWQGLKKEFDIFAVGLTAPRNVLYKKVDVRVLSRIDQGMIEEADWLHSNGLSFERMRNLGLEYGVLADYLEGVVTSKDDLIKSLQGKIHAYIRRQLTWFKKFNDVFWFDISEKDFTRKVENAVGKWYHQTNDTKD
ncbi:tRNA (adenosine(37)-N6)-dimethylallyltransferase MiaA [Candidatus Daviesbacteria bacterium]|nr:tRNA (adenosine(37)-N6)-dimethylallyltransferase MiaA [Candidatus Daviesbacteria bacterium]